MNWLWASRVLGCCALLTSFAGCNLLDDPCSFVQCRDGLQCREKKSSCERQPCITPVECVPAATASDDGCAAEEEGCLPEGASSCAAVLCIGGTVCVESASGAQCLPLEEVNPCAAIDCDDGMVCAMVQSECASGSCQEAAACVPEQEAAGAACGDGYCGVGQVCCNTSCGICAEPGDACSQQECGAFE